MTLVGTIRENLKFRTPGTWQVASAGTSRVDFQLCGETGCQERFAFFWRKCEMGSAVFFVKSGDFSSRRTKGSKEKGNNDAEKNS